MNTLITNGTILTPDGVLPDSSLYIEGSVIRAVGEPPADAHPHRTLNARGGIVMPGLINAHTHVPMTLFRGYADDLTLHDWLFEHIFPAEDKLTPEAVYWGSLLSFAEMIQSGITAFADMYFFSESIIKALVDSGLRGNVTRTITGTDAIGYKKPLDELNALYAEYNGAANGRVQIDYALHAPYTCGPEAIRATADEALKRDAVMQVHISETLKENEDCLRDYGMSPTQYFAHNGLFDCKVNAAHCVHLSEEDMGVFAAARDAGIAHNPVSNLKLASGIARVPDMLRRGIPVGLGTDGVASNNCLNLFAEMKLAAILQKGVTLDPTVIPAPEAFKMATQNGAHLLGRSDIGAIAPGFKADIVLLDANSPRLHPLHNAVSTVVYSADSGDVDTVLVDGELLLQNKQFTQLDMQEILRNVYQYINV